MHIVFPQLPDKLVFAGTPQRKTFPLGGRWHGEAVTDEGKRGDFLSGNGKRGKVRRCSSDSVRRKPSVRQPLIRPSVRTGAPSPEGNVINLRRFRRGRCPHRPFPTVRIRRSVVPKGYHSPRGDVGIAPYGAVVDA